MSSGLQGGGHILGGLSRTESFSLQISRSYTQQAPELGLPSGETSSPSHLPMGLLALAEAQISPWGLCSLYTSFMDGVGLYQLALIAKVNLFTPGTVRM